MGLLLGLLIQLYTLILLARVIVSWIPAANQEWTPRGVTLVAVEAVYFLTDPPVRALRRIIRPLAIGAMRIDLSVIVLFLLLGVLRILVAAIAQ